MSLRRSPLGPLSLVWVMLLLVPGYLLAQAPPEIVEISGGRWFDGNTFVDRTMYVASGRFTRVRPASPITRVVEAVGLYIVPPFGDAHTHHFDNPQTTPELVARYLEEGTFYAKVMTEPRSRAVESAAFVNSPSSVDVIYAHGGLTSSYSHPIEVYESVKLGLMSREQQRTRASEIRASRLREGDAYYIIDSLADLEAKWPQILAGRPGFIKVYVRGAECYHVTGWPKNPGTWDYSGGGLAPEIVPHIVRRARAAGLRVTAAVNTSFDVHVAVASGVNEISHLPGYQRLGSVCGDVSKKITPWDAKLAADRNVAFIVIANEFLENGSPEVVENTKANIATLREWNAPIAIGSSTYGSSPLAGVLAMDALGVFDRTELLRIWSMTTPLLILPDRAVGCLDEGCEASFIGLECDPTVKFECVKAIRLRMKQGQLLSTP